MLPKIKKILYATGMGAGAPHVFRYALTMASQLDAQIIAVSAIEPLPAFAQSLVELHVSHQEAEQKHLEARNLAKERLKERITRLCEKECGTDPRCNNRVNLIQVEDGHPAEIILANAKRQGNERRPGKRQCFCSRKSGGICCLRKRFNK